MSSMSSVTGLKIASALSVQMPNLAAVDSPEHRKVKPIPSVGSSAEQAFNPPAFDNTLCKVPTQRNASGRRYARFPLLACFACPCTDSHDSIPSPCSNIFDLDPDVGKELMDIFCFKVHPLCPGLLLRCMLRRAVVDMALYFAQDSKDSPSGVVVSSPPCRTSNPIVRDHNFRFPVTFQAQPFPTDLRQDWCKATASSSPKVRVEGFFSPMNVTESHCAFRPRLV